METKWHQVMKKNSGNTAVVLAWDETGLARRETGCDGGGCVEDIMDEVRKVASRRGKGDGL